MIICTVLYEDFTLALRFPLYLTNIDWSCVS